MIYLYKILIKVPVKTLKNDSVIAVCLSELNNHFGRAWCMLLLVQNKQVTFESPDNAKYLRIIRKLFFFSVLKTGEGEGGGSWPLEFGYHATLHLSLSPVVVKGANCAIY